MITAPDEQALAGAPVLPTGALPEFTLLSGREVAPFASRLALPPGSGELLQSIQALLADDIQRRRLVDRLPQPEDVAATPLSLIADVLLQGLPYDAAGYPSSSSMGSTGLVVEVASLVSADLAAVKFLDRDYVSTKSATGGAHLEQIYPIAGTYLRGTEQGRPVVFISVTYRYKVPSGKLEYVLGMRSRELVFALRIKESLDLRTGIATASYYASALDDPTKRDGQFVWLAGRDHWLPLVGDHGQVRAYILVTEFGWDLSDHDESKDELLADVHRNHRYFSNKAPTIQAARETASLAARVGAGYASQVGAVDDGATQAKFAAAAALGDPEALVELANYAERTGDGPAARSFYHRAIAAGVPIAGQRYAEQLLKHARMTDAAEWLADLPMLQALTANGLASGAEEAAQVQSLLGPPVEAPR